MDKFLGVLDKFESITNYIPLSANSLSRPVKNMVRLLSSQSSLS